MRHILHLALDPAPQRTAAVAVLSLPADHEDKNIAAPFLFLHFNLLHFLHFYIFMWQ